MGGKKSKDATLGILTVKRTATNTGTTIEIRVISLVYFWDS
jgi:hypothetical protein